MLAFICDGPWQVLKMHSRPWLRAMGRIAHSFRRVWACPFFLALICCGPWQVLKLPSRPWLLAMHSQTPQAPRCMGHWHRLGMSPVHFAKPLCTGRRGAERLNSQILWSKRWKSSGVTPLFFLCTNLWPFGATPGGKYPPAWAPELKSNPGQRAPAGPGFWVVSGVALGEVKLEIPRC